MKTTRSDRALAVATPGPALHCRAGRHSALSASCRPSSRWRRARARPRRGRRPDIDGKAFVKERVEPARSRSTFWHDYQFINPVTRKIEPKRMYCERLDEVVVCGGIYR
jgi:hypothetical protein